MGFFVPMNGTCPHGSYGLIGNVADRFPGELFLKRAAVLVRLIPCALLTGQCLSVLFFFFSWGWDQTQTLLLSHIPSQSNQMLALLY